MSRTGFIFSSLLLGIVLAITSCAKIDLFEKNVSFNKFEWQSNYKPAIKFHIEDTSSLYNIYVVVRHADAYGYNNIWLNVYTKSPVDTIAKQQQLDLTLGNNETGWLGTGMDDIFEHRIRITAQPYKFPRKGDYEFTLEQIMREDPLKNILNIGIRIEKVP